MAKWECVCVGGGICVCVWGVFVNTITLEQFDYNHPEIFYGSKL